MDDIDVNKILVSKENHISQKIHSNTLSDTIIMTLLYRYT